LYVSGGDGASFTFADYGQDGSPLNPCGDPPVGVGGTQTPPTAQGGALRSQDVRTTGDPTSLDGTILRIDPTTGAGLPGNPFYASADPNMRRIVGYGLRNPFRITVRPGTNEVWAGDVGWNAWEEINRLTSPADGGADNFGWPCYEGAGRQSGYDAANLTLCENLYTSGSAAVVAPYFRYHHSDLVHPTDVCPVGGSSVAGVAFASQNGGNYPPEYRGALFFADYTRGCIWSAQAGPNGLPDPAKIHTFVSGAAQPVDVQIGPGGDLFYVDLGGTIRRIRYLSANQPPIAVINADPTNGPAPLTVAFVGTGSTDPDGDPITYAWDLDGDGAFDDSTSPTTSYTYSQAGTYTPRLQVTDDSGATATASMTISAGNTPPRPVMDSPADSLTWRVGDTISFSGHATDDQDGTLPPSALTWSLILHHCPSTCHEHPLRTFSGTSSGSFVAPDHEYPAHLELRLTATDSGGLGDTVSTSLHPQTVQLAFATQPSGLALTVGSSSRATPFSRTVITGSTVSISANSPQAFGGQIYQFVSWSDGGAQTHTVVANQATTHTATLDVSSDAVLRVQGSDRVATAIDASQFLFGDAPSGAEAVVLARSDLFPDALAGVPLAAASSGPLLITPPTELDSRVAAEIQRTLPVDKPVYLLGGTGALSQAVEDQVKALGYSTVIRLAGPDRFATALAIAVQVEQVLGGAPSVVLVATGRNFPDALAAGAAAGIGGVVVLSNDATLPQPVRDYVVHKQQVDNALVATVGGPAVPSYPDADAAISGADRYQTAALVADFFFGGTGPVVAGLATGANFPDALSGGAVMALLGGPMLLTNPTTLNAHPKAFLTENRATIDAALIFGGTGAVSNLVDGQVAAAIAD
jgi:putative cell wall-binding protein